MTVENAIAIAQILVGAAVAVMVPVVSWVVYAIVEAKTKIVALETRADGLEEETDRRFDDVKDWLKKIDHKLDKLIEHEKN